jgi:4'-phosphopantetheinyl transferase EntD
MPIVSISEFDNQLLWGVWQIGESVDALCEALPTHEVTVLATQIKHPQKLIESLSARVLVKEMLGRQGIMYEGLAKTPEKAPYLPNASHRVSISHTAHYAVAVLHPCLPVGIDIEQARPQLQRVAGRVLSPTELAFVQDLAQLSLLWSAKETLYKCYALRQLDFIRDMQIAPFELAEKGTFVGKLFPDSPDAQSFTIHYAQIDATHYCTWTV